MTKPTKRLIALLLILLIGCVSSVGLVADAADGVRTSGIWQYEIVQNCAVIRACSGPVDGKISIPDAIDGYPVLAWDDYVFAKYKDFEFIIPASFPKAAVDAFKQQGEDEEEIWEDIFAIYRLGFADVAANAFAVADNNPYLTSVDGVLYSKDKRILIKYPICKKGSFFALPNSVDLFESFLIYSMVPFATFDIRDNMVCPDNLTVHISSDQMSVCYNTLLQKTGNDFDAALHMLYVADCLAGVTTVCTDWKKTPVIDGEDLFDILNEMAEEEGAASELKYPNWVRCTGHNETGSRIRAFFQKVLDVLDTIATPFRVFFNWIASLFGTRRA